MEVVMKPPDTESIIPWEVYELKQQNIRDNNMWFLARCGWERVVIKFNTQTHNHTRTKKIHMNIFFFFFFLINWKSHLGYCTNKTKHIGSVSESIATILFVFIKFFMVFQKQNKRKEQQKQPPTKTMKD